MAKGFFITATDTGVGKTVATAALGLLLQQQGVRVGVMKPVQCAGNDAQFLKKTLGLKENLSVINPMYAPEPLSPHLALRRSKQSFDLKKIRSSLKVLSEQYDVILMEGAGGLMVPLKENYYNADLIRDLKAEVIVVARLGLGTINHTLLTIHQAARCGLKIKGILFSDTNPGRKTLPEKTNAQEIEKLSKIKNLGTIPYLKTLTAKNILKKCQHLKRDI